MEVVSLCPLRVASIVWQPSRGGFALTVVAKATFRLLPGEARLAEEQEYPNDDDNHWNDDPARSLYSPNDLVPFKARPDLLLVGHAFAPRKEPVRSLIARLTIGDVDKAIEVTGDRALSPDGKIREPARFAKMPLRYERTAGGPDTWNPVGVRSDARPDAYGAVALPNLLPAGSALTSRMEVYAPVAFGPIAPGWPSRRQHLGPHTARVESNGWNDGPLPEDLDPAYFNAAPEDQRPAELRDDQKMVLENLHPDHPRLLTMLPGVRPCAFVDMPGRQPPQRLHMEPDTLWIDTDRSICTLVWRGRVPIESKDQVGRVVVAMEEGQKRLGWADVQRMLTGPSAGSAQEGTEILGVESSAAPSSAAPSSSLPTPPPPAPDLALAPTGFAPMAAPALATTSSFSRSPLPPPPPAAPSSSALPPPPPAPTSAAVISPPAPAISSPPALVSPPMPSPPRAVSHAITIASISSTTAPPSPAAPPIVAATAPRSDAPRGVVELLWFDPSALPKVRAHPLYGPVLGAAPAGNVPAELRDRRSIARVVARGPAVDEAGLAEAMASAVAEGDLFEPPLVVVAGELVSLFDEVATLEAMFFAASPLASSDTSLKDALEAAASMLKTPRIQVSIGLAADVVQRIQEAFVAGNRALVRSHIDAQAERMLLAQRAFQRRSVLGEPHLCAHLTLAGGKTPIPAYLPEALSTRLPMFARVQVRALAEAHLSQDQHETCRTSLRVLALSRAAELSPEAH